MVIGHVKTGVTAALHDVADAFRCVNALVIRLVRIEFDKIAGFAGVAEEILAAVPARLREVVGFERDHADMAGLFAGQTARRFLVHFHLESVEGQEILICELGMRDEYVVVGIRDDRIPLRLIGFLQLLDRQLAVGNRGMAVQIGFIEFAGLGNQIFSHGLAPLAVILVCTRIYSCLRPRQHGKSRDFRAAFERQYST